MKIILLVPHIYIRSILLGPETLLGNLEREAVLPREGTFVGSLEAEVVLVSPTLIGSVTLGSCREVTNDMEESEDGDLVEPADLLSTFDS